MDLNTHEEKILKAIEKLGPDHVCNRLFQDARSQKALARLIREKLITPDFSATDEMADQFMSGRAVKRDEFDLHFTLTEKGLEYAREIYIPNRLFHGKTFVAGVLIMLVVMVGITLWLM